jgi:hypothetical protein
MSVKIKVTVVVFAIAIVVCTLIFLNSSTALKSKHGVGKRNIHQGKTLGLFALTTEVETLANSTILRVEAVPNKSITRATINWFLPTSIKILGGETQLHFENFWPKGEPKIFEIEVDQLGHEPIHAEIFTKINDIKMGAVETFVRKPKSEKLSIQSLSTKTLIY